MMINLKKCYFGEHENGKKAKQPYCWPGDRDSGLDRRPHQPHIPLSQSRIRSEARAPLRSRAAERGDPHQGTRAGRGRRRRLGGRGRLHDQGSAGKRPVFQKVQLS